MKIKNKNFSGYHATEHGNRHNRICSVCGEPAHIFSSRSDPVCLRAECNHVLAKKKHMSEFSYKQYFFLQSAQIKYTIEQSALRKKRMEEKKRTENKENISCWMTAINRDNGYDPELYPYTVIPTNSKKITKLPKRRQKIFYEFLWELIHESMEGIEDSEANREDRKDEAVYRNKDEGNVIFFEKKACSLCRGGCCRIGEEHAFLNEETILRYVSRHPDQKPEQVMSAFLTYLPEKTFKESCVYHTETGCSLPRNMRSHVCTDYLCDALYELRELFGREAVPKGIFFISRAQDNWNKNDLDADNRIVTSELILNLRN